MTLCSSAPITSTADPVALAAAHDRLYHRLPPESLDLHVCVLVARRDHGLRRLPVAGKSSPRSARVPSFVTRSRRRGSPSRGSSRSARCTTSACGTESPRDDDRAAIEMAALDAVAQADLVRRKEVTPAELAQWAIERIEDLNPTLNAVITPMYDQALSAAATTTDRPGLAGVPCLVKDLIAEVAGVPFSEGSRFCAATSHTSTPSSSSACGARDWSSWARPTPLIRDGADV